MRLDRRPRSCSGIAPSQILLALPFAALLACGEKLRLPRIWLPLALFLLGTVISLLLSDDPAAGLPQIRKFYVFLELLVIFSLLRSLAMVRLLFLTWAGIGALTAIRGCVQFAGKVQEAHRLGRDFYEFYVGERITGFTSHWNTYSAEEMFALIMLVSFLFFAPQCKKRLWVWLLCGALDCSRDCVGTNARDLDCRGGRHALSDLVLAPLDGRARASGAAGGVLRRTACNAGSRHLDLQAEGS